MILGSGVWLARYSLGGDSVLKATIQTKLPPLMQAVLPDVRSAISLSSSPAVGGKVLGGPGVDVVDAVSVVPGAPGAPGAPSAPSAPGGPTTALATVVPVVPVIQVTTTTETKKIRPIKHTTPLPVDYCVDEEEVAAMIKLEIYLSTRGKKTGTQVENARKQLLIWLREMDGMSDHVIIMLANAKKVDNFVSSQY
jgi:Flp pilus assembly protein CpaB